VSPLRAILVAELRKLGHAAAGVRRESRLKIVVVATGMVLLWLVMFALAWGSLRAIDRFGVGMVGDAAVSISEVMMPRVLGIAAAVLQVMLVLSCALLAF